jgi:hypothetical protein
LCSLPSLIRSSLNQPQTALDPIESGIDAVDANGDIGD